MEMSERLEFYKETALQSKRTFLPKKHACDCLQKFKHESRGKNTSDEHDDLVIQ